MPYDFRAIAGCILALGFAVGLIVGILELLGYLKFIREIIDRD